MRKIAIISLTLINALALSACGANSSDSAAEIATQVAAQLQTQAAAITPAAASATSEPTATEAASGPEVVFLPGGLFDAAERARFMQKIGDPFIHYYADLAEHPPLLTVTVEHYSGDLSFVYTVEAIFETGIYIGWLAPGSPGAPDWWIPECMGACPLSDSFRAAFPEIVATLEP